MNRNGYCIVSGLVFGLIAIAHAYRAAMQTPAQLGGTDVPVWVSWVSVAVAGVLSIWAFRSAAAPGPAAGTGE